MSGWHLEGKSSMEAGRRTHSGGAQVCALQLSLMEVSAIFSPWGRAGLPEVQWPRSVRRVNLVCNPWKSRGPSVARGIYACGFSSNGLSHHHAPRGESLWPRATHWGRGLTLQGLWGIKMDESAAFVGSIPAFVIPSPLSTLQSHPPVEHLDICWRRDPGEFYTHKRGSTRASRP